MFEINFQEIFIVIIVFILLIKPAEMPKIVKDIAHFFRTIKDKIIDAKLELERIMELDERPGKSSTSTSDNKTRKLKKEETPRNVSYKRTKISKKKNGKKK